MRSAKLTSFRELVFQLPLNLEANIGYPTDFFRRRKTGENQCTTLLEPGIETGPREDFEGHCRVKGTGHYWYLLKIIVRIKNLLGNKHWRAVDSINHCEETTPSQVT